MIEEIKANSPKTDVFLDQSALAEAIQHNAHIPLTFSSLTTGLQ